MTCVDVWALAVALLAALATPARAADDANVALNFQDVELPVLAKFVSEVTGRNFIVDDRVRGKVTIISPTRITPDEAYVVFQSVLQVKGFTTVPSGAVVRIIPTKDAKETSLRTLEDGTAGVPSEEYVTRLIPLTQVDATPRVTAGRGRWAGCWPTPPRARCSG